MQTPVDVPSLDEAISIMVADLRAFIEGRRQKDYGYHVCPSQTAHRWAWAKSSRDQSQAQRLAIDVSPLFYEAAWELCRRGILRPGLMTRGMQALEDWGYSLTSFGTEWLKNANGGDLVILESGSLAQVLSGYAKLFGEGFHQRSQEAIGCRRTEAWLACCAMVGAASESILLSVAIAKTGNEEEVLESYSRRDGRRNVIKLLVGGAPKHLADAFATFMGLLSYWRDDAAHGKVSPISVANADEALRQLLHLCQWTEANWELLAGKTS